MSLIVITTFCIMHAAGRFEPAPAAHAAILLTCGGVGNNAGHLTMEDTDFGPQASKQQLSLSTVHVSPLVPALQHCWPCYSEVTALAFQIIDFPGEML